MLEELDKVAEEYADKEAAKKVDPKEWNDYFIQHSFTGEDIYEAFKAGANWQKSSVWHNPSEDHDENKPLLVLTQINTLAFWKGKFDTDKMTQQFGFTMAAEYNKPAEPMIKKWAYIKDILPTMK